MHKVNNHNVLKSILKLIIIGILRLFLVPYRWLDDEVESGVSTSAMIVT